MSRSPLLAYLAGFALCAQPIPNLEIRGRVIELGLDAGVAGAEVTLSEFILVDNAVTRSTFATVFTGPDGSFRFQPLRLGDYSVEVRKEGYQGGSRDPRIGVDPASLTEAPVTLTREKPSQEIRFTMTRPGQITGRVVDETREPIAGLNVAVQERVKRNSFAELTAMTGQDGSFHVPNVPPGEFFVRISSPAAERVRTDFLPEDAAIVDQELELSYWPGGMSNTSGNPLTVNPGGAASVGTITLRKTPRYRIRVSTHDTCSPGETVAMIATNALSRIPDYENMNAEIFTCAAEFLVENLPPGSYDLRFFISSSAKWALARVNVTSSNQDLDIAFAASMDIPGRVVGAEQAKLPSLSDLSIRLGIAGMSDVFGNAGPPVIPDAEGAFVLKNVAWPRHVVSVQLRDAKFYVKEVRYGGRAAEGGVFTSFPGAELEIVIDDKAAGVKGSVTLNDKPVTGGAVMAVGWPLPPAELRGNSRLGSPVQGRFELAGLAPGEYRVFAVSVSDANKLGDPATLFGFASRGESVRLAPSESRTLTLKLLQ